MLHCTPLAYLTSQPIRMFWLTRSFLMLHLAPKVSDPTLFFFVFGFLAAGAWNYEAGLPRDHMAHAHMHRCGAYEHTNIILM